MMKTIATVRQAVESDLLAILAIYNEVIATSTAVYTLEPSTIEDRRMWFSSRCASGFPVQRTLSAMRFSDLLLSEIGEAHGRDIAIPSSIQFTSGMMFAAKGWGAH